MLIIIIILSFKIMHGAVNKTDLRYPDNFKENNFLEVSSYGNCPLRGAQHSLMPVLNTMLTNNILQVIFYQVKCNFDRLTSRAWREGAVTS